MNKSLLSLRLLVGTLISCATILCSFFALQSHMRVDVDRKEPVIATKYLKPNEIISELGPDTKARCDFRFELESYMDYDILEKAQDNGSCLVRLKISTVHARLTLPIEILYPPAPDEKTRAHEMGHATICKRVYLQASSAIKEAAKPVLERTYTGQGANLDEALGEALQIAVNELGEDYNLNTSMVARDIFEIYDFLELGENSNSNDSVEESFKRFEHGKTRRITQKGVPDLDCCMIELNRVNLLY